MPGELLLPGDRGNGDCGDANEYRAEPSRWWVLAVYSYSSALQGLLWMTFSSVESASKAFLHVDSNALNMILNEGPIAYCLVVLFASLLFLRSGGLRLSVLLGCAMCFFASVLRLAPIYFDDAARLAHSGSIIWFVYVAQFINAAAAPLTQASPALISQTWFEPKQRSLASGIARVSNSAGRAVGFFLAPALVADGAGGDMPRFLFVEMVVALVPLLCAAAYFPDKPRSPPSRSAQQAAEQQAAASKALAQAALGERPKGRGGIGIDGGASGGGGGGGGREGGDGYSSSGELPSLGALWRDCVRIVREKNNLTLVLAFGCQMGVYGAWSGVLSPVLTSGGQFSSAQAGTLGSVNTFAGIVGGTVAGYVADSPLFATRLKGLMQVRRPHTITIRLSTCM